MRQRRGDVERILVTEQMAKEMAELSRHLKPLHAFLVKSGVSKVDAGDILQDAFIKVFNRRDTLPESVEQRKAILFGEVNVQMKAHFTERNRLLHRAARAHELIAFMGLTEQREMSGVFEARQLLELAFSEISPDQYQVFTDRVLDNLTIMEVAEHLSMNPHTTKTNWFRALEVLREKLDHIERRGGRGFISFLVVASILGLAKNAMAMFELLKRFFRTMRHLHVHHLRGMMTGAMVMFSPPQSGASVNAAASLTQHETSAHDSAGITESKLGGALRVQEKRETAEVPRVSNAAQSSVPPASSRQNVSINPAMRMAPPDYLIAMAIVALRNGQPEKALVLIDQYAATDAKAANSGTVKVLRADARAAMAAH